MSRPLVEIENLEVCFVTRDATVRAVNGLSLRIMPGEVLCPIGESGSGKSVTMRALMRLLPKGKTRFGSRVRVGDSDILSLRERELKSDQVTRRIKHMKMGSRGHELHKDLIVKPEDETVFKQRFSAFIQGSSGLPEMLRTQGFDTVLITGTVTNVCCESSARDAMMVNFKTIMVSDANAALTDEEHNATLSSIYSTFGDVMDTDYLIGRLRKNAVVKEAAE